MDHKRKGIVRFIIVLMILLIGICIALGIMGIISRGENSLLHDSKTQLENENADYKSQVESLQNQVEELQGMVEQKNKEIEDLKTRLEEMERIDISKLEPGTLIELEDIKGYTDEFFRQYEIQKGDPVHERIYGRSYRDNNNIGLEDLKYLKMIHYNFDHQIQVGEMIVNEDISDDVINIFKELFAIEYEVESMYLIDNYWTGDGGTSDTASIEENNTSAFCYRVITGGGNLSNHAYGRAIDINPQQNPYVYLSGGEWRWSHENATPYIDRDCGDPHVIVKGDACYSIFEKYGFSWGGNWSNPLDYQHFEKES